MERGHNDRNHLKYMGRSHNDRNHLKHKNDRTRSQWPKSPETYKGWDAVAMTEITWNIQRMGHGRHDWNHRKHTKDGTRSPWSKSSETYKGRDAVTMTEITWNIWDTVIMTEITISATSTQTEHKLIGIRPIDMGAPPKTQTHNNKMMTDRYRCGPNSNWTKWIGIWPIDIGATLKLELTGKMIDWYRCGPESN